MKKAIICFILVSILIAGCGKEKLVTGNAEIDWVDFIKVKGITYLADFETTGFDLDKGGVGKEYARVKYKVSDNVHNPSYEIQNGDAAFLEVGTKIYALNGYSPDCRLAVYVNEKVRIYDVDSNPDAIKGEDLLDIGGKVQYIDVIKEDENGLSEKYKIGAVDNVSKLVNYILDAEVDYNKQLKFRIPCIASKH